MSSVQCAQLISHKSRQHRSHNNLPFNVHSHYTLCLVFWKKHGHETLVSHPTSAKMTVLEWQNDLLKNVSVISFGDIFTRNMHSSLIKASHPPCINFPIDDLIISQFNIIMIVIELPIYFSGRSLKEQILSDQEDWLEIIIWISNHTCSTYFHGRKWWIFLRRKYVSAKHSKHVSTKSQFLRI